MESNFEIKLIDDNNKTPFPYVDPTIYWKAPVYHDAEGYIPWFETNILSVKNRGMVWSFIVGDPGSGKTHLLCHLNYLYYEEMKEGDQKYNGLYSIISANEYEEISSDILWTNFFRNVDVQRKIKQEINSFIVNNYNFNRSHLKKLVKNYINNPAVIEKYSGTEKKDLAIGISELLTEKGMHICLVLDNIDEYMRGIDYQYTINEKTIKQFFNTLRRATTNVKNIILLLSCTVDAYNTLKDIQSDATYSSRLTFHNKTIKPLNLTDAFQMISKYIEHWSIINGVKIPIKNDSIIDLSDCRQINVYPFTRQSINAIHKVGNQYARSIKTICDDCINYMKNEKEFRIIEDKYLINMLEYANMSRPSLVPNENIYQIKLDMPEYIADEYESKIVELESKYSNKYDLINYESIKKSFDRFCEYLGFEVIENLSPVERVDNKSYQTNPDLFTIINYEDDDGDKRILLYYLISENKPIGGLYDKYIERRDVLDCISYIEKGYADCGIIIRLWSGIARPAINQYRQIRNHLDSSIKDFSIDHVYDKILYLINDVYDEKEKLELINHIENNEINFINRVKSLRQHESRPTRSHEEILKEIRKRAAEF